MIRVLDYAQLAADVYQTGSTHGSLYGNIYTVHHKEVNTLISTKSYGWARVLGISPQMKTNNHFFAQLYIRFSQNQVKNAVIAVRGTVFDDWTNVLVDVINWAPDVLGGGSHHFYQSIYFLILLYCQASIDYLNSNFPQLRPTLRLTGHSLGGSTAKLITLRAALGIPVVSFNAPGIAHLLPKSPANNGFIHNINSSYGLINKIGQPFQPILYIDIQQYRKEAMRLLETFDKAIYDQSMVDYKHHQKAKGFIDRMKSYEPTKQIIKEMTEYKNEHDHCTQQITAEHQQSRHHFRQSYHMYYDMIGAESQELQYALRQSGCDFKSLWHGYKHVIQEQHSIDNMLKALHSPSHSDLASIII